MARDLDELIGQLAAGPRLRAPSMPRLDRYEIVRRLGRGTFGDIYEARDRRYGTTVALKALRHDDPDSIYRFKNEFRAVAGVRHPNLVKLYELFSEGDRWYFSMELVEGRAFDEYLRRVPEHTLSAFAQLGAAIEALHRAATLHRDVKPNNVLVEDCGRVVLLDFGLAWEPLGRGPTVSGGTPLYMAPEQGLGAPVTASDWYSVGVMLYETIAGRPPWMTNPVAMARAKVHAPVPPIDAPSGPAAHLAAMAMRMLAADPDHRPPAHEILAAFRGAPPRGELRPDVELIGRDAELAWLEASLARSRLRTQLCLVEGPPGIGKSMMARELCRRAAARGAHVFDGRCHEAEAVPFKGLDAAVDSLCNYLVHADEAYVRAVVPAHAEALSLMFPVLRRLDAVLRGTEPPVRAHSPHEIRRHATDALAALLAGVAADAPVIIFLDDLQWAGEDTFSLLAEVLVRAPSVMFLATLRVRATETSGALEAFLSRAATFDAIDVGTLAVPPLDRAAVASLVERSAQRGISADAAWAASAGHPYVLARMLGATGWQAGDLGDNLRRSLDQVSADARRLLEIVALSAMPLPQSMGCLAAGFDGWRPEVVDELREQGLIRTGTHAESLMDVYHDRVRETVEASLSAERYRAAHAELAEFLEGRRNPPAHVLATHYREAGRQGPARTWMHRAAREAARALAFERAARTYAAAAELSAGEDALALHLEWADAMALAGHRAESGRICLAAATLASDGGWVGWASQLRATAGEHLLISGRLTEGMALIGEALAAVGLALPADPYVAVAGSINIGARLVVRGFAFEPRDADAIAPRLLRQIDLLLATAQALNQNDVRSAFVSARALELALEAGHPLRVLRALFFYVMSNAQRDPRHPFFRAALDASEALVARVGGTQERARHTLLRGVVELFAGSVGDATATLEAAQRLCWNATPPLVLDGAMGRVPLLAAYAYCGANPARALAVLDGWISEAAARQDLNAQRWLQSTSVWVLLAADQPDRARARLQEASTGERGEHDLFASMKMLQETAIRVYETPAASCAWIEGEARPAFDRIFASLVPLTRGTFALLRAHAAASAWRAGTADVALARSVLEEGIAVLADGDVLTPGVASLQAQIALMSDDRDRAASAFERAARGWSTQGMLTYAAASGLRAAELRADRAAVDARRAELLALGVAHPGRMADLLVGPGR
ncbi:MAG: protein kinase [Kofleriaceae bacterium]|nr:protein kinase [Kofleriaceae bacterium]